MTLRISQHFRAQLMHGVLVVQLQIPWAIFFFIPLYLTPYYLIPVMLIKAWYITVQIILCLTVIHYSEPKHIKIWLLFLIRIILILSIFFHVEYFLLSPAYTMQ